MANITDAAGPDEVERRIRIAELLAREAEAEVRLLEALVKKVGLEAKLKGEKRDLVRLAKKRKRTAMAHAGGAAAGSGS